MDTQKDKAGKTLRKAPTVVETDLRNHVRIVQSTFAFGDELSIVDDDRGRDPYNSTGAHCIIKFKDN